MLHKDLLICRIMPWSFPSEDRISVKITCDISYGDVFPLWRENYDHVTFTNKDYFPPFSGKCAHMENISSARRDLASLQPRSRPGGKTFSHVIAFVMSCGVAI